MSTIMMLPPSRRRQYAHERRTKHGYQARKYHSRTAEYPENQSAKSCRNLYGCRYSTASQQARRMADQHRPYRGGHFAAFPPKLAETCLLAGCPPGGVVLDPFLGSGTTAAVAKQLGRHYIGIELNPEYCTLAEKRIGGVAV